MRRELSGDDHLLQLVDIFLDFDVREYVFPTGFDGDRKLLAVGGYGLDDHRIFARGSRKFEIAVPVGHPAEYRIFSETVMYSAGAPSVVMTLPEILTFTRFCPAAGRTDNNNRMTVQIFLIMGFWFYSFAKVGGMKRAGNHPF